NAPHPSLLALDHDRVADADRPFGQQDEAGYEIRHDGLQPKPDTDRKGAGNQRNLLQVEAEPRQRHNDRRDRAEIPKVVTIESWRLGFNLVRGSSSVSSQRCTMRVTMSNSRRTRAAVSSVSNDR